MGLLSYLFGDDPSPFVKVDGMPDVGQGDGWTESSWRRAPKKIVRTSDLVSTNLGGYLSRRRVKKYASGGGGTPYVVEHRGRYYIADGHHRAAAAIARGDTTIQVRVKRGGDR